MPSLAKPSRVASRPQSATAHAIPKSRPTSPVPQKLTRTACACGGTCPSCRAEAAPIVESRSKPIIGTPGDRFEREADRLADRATSAPASLPLKTERHEQNGAGAAISQSSAGGYAAANSSGHPLDPGTRTYMESRFGHDFARVRIHTDRASAATAEALNARAFTVGEDIYFNSGEFRPGSYSGRQLVAHELAHVTQQRTARSAPLIQPKLRLTGAAADTARVMAVLNSGLFGYTAVVDGTGVVSLSATSIQGPPTASQQELHTRLDSIITDASTVSIAVASGSATLIGSYAGESIDIADIEKTGTGPGGSIATLIHELTEQYQKQVKGQKYPAAHGAGGAAESAVVGATRGTERIVSQSSNPDGTVNLVVEVPWTYPDGHVVTVRMVIDHNNVTSVTRS